MPNLELMEDHWEHHYCEKYMQTYYWNNITGKSQWAAPWVLVQGRRERRAAELKRKATEEAAQKAAKETRMEVAKTEAAEKEAAKEAAKEEAAKEHGGYRVWGRWQGGWGGWRGGWGGWRGGWGGWDGWGGGWDDGGWGSSSQQTLEIVTTCYLEDHGHGYHDMRTFCLRTSSTASSPSIGSNAPARSPTCMLLRQA